MSKPQSKIYRGKVVKKLVQPVSITMKAVKLDADTWKLVHTERFSLKGRKKMEKVMAATITLFKQMDFKIRVKGDTISYSRTGPLSMAASAIVGEMFQWTQMADMTFRDIFYLSLMSKTMLGKGARSRLRPEAAGDA